MSESNALTGVPVVANQLGNEKQRRCCTTLRGNRSVVYHPDVMTAAQALISAAWRKDVKGVPGAVDCLLDELKKHPANEDDTTKTGKGG